MTITLPEAPTSTLTVRPWPDPVIDAVGHDPRSHYVQQFWLGVLGPSTTGLTRRPPARLQTPPGGLEPPERPLMRWKLHPALCRESAAWAWDRHRAALHAANGANG